MGEARINLLLREEVLRYEAQVAVQVLRSYLFLQQLNNPTTNNDLPLKGRIALIMALKQCCQLARAFAKCQEGADQEINGD